MLKFILKHWLAFGLLVLGIVLLVFNVGNFTTGGLAIGCAILSFFERLLAGSTGAVGQPNTDPARQVDDDLDVLRRQGEEAERVDQEAIRIVASRKRQDTH